MRDPVLERRKARPSDWQMYVVIRKGSDIHSLRWCEDVSIGFSHEIAQATANHCSNASRNFVRVYANQRMRRFLRRSKRRRGMGRYRDYNDEYLYGELGLLALGARGPFKSNVDSGCVKGRAGSGKYLPTDRRGAAGAKSCRAPPIC
jgi:hypothetical protein